MSSYEVCIGTNSLSCDIRLATVSASQSSYVFAPPPGQLVHAAVRGINAQGRGAFSTEQQFSIPSINPLINQTTAPLTPITPLNVFVTDPDGSRLTFSHTGLPVGLSLSATTGRITGTPTTAGTYNVTIFVNDGLVTVSRSFLWTVRAGATADLAAPALTITSHTSGLVLTSASQTIRGTVTDSGNGGSGVTIVRVNGLTASGGVASGNETASWSRTITLGAGSNVVTVEAVDGAGNIQMQQMTLQLGTSGTHTDGDSDWSAPIGGSTPISDASATSGGPLTITGFASNLLAPQLVGTSITFSAGVTGGRPPYQFKWLVFNDLAWTVQRDWSSSNSYTWRPTAAGGNRVAVWVRDSTTTADVALVSTSMPYRIRDASATTTATSTLTPATTWTDSAPTTTSTDSTPSSPESSPTPTSTRTRTRTPSWGPITVASLTSNLDTPQAPGTSITFTAAITGGSGQYQTRWLLYNGTTWTVVSNWGYSNTYTWMTRETGAYIIAVEALDAASMTATPVGSSLAFRIKTPR